MLETDRLILRPWEERDRAAQRIMNADPEVMRYFEAPMTDAETDAHMERNAGWQRDLGFSFWATIRKADGLFLGICGLKPLTVPWPEPSDIEIGWRFAAHAWGQGYATEAARAALAFGLARAPRVIAMTNQANRPSWMVMERLGMRRVPELDFDHPNVSDGHSLRPHIVYVKEA